MANWMIIRFAALATFSMALVAAPSFTPAFAAEEEAVASIGVGEISSFCFGHQLHPQPHSQQAKEMPGKHSSIDDPLLLKGIARPIRRSTIATTMLPRSSSFRRSRPRLADHPNVANLINYSYRKLGDYEALARVWYERALKADPNHVLTWDIMAAVADRAGQPASRRSIILAGSLRSVWNRLPRSIRSLADALEKPPAQNLVY